MKKRVLIQLLFVLVMGLSVGYSQKKIIQTDKEKKECSVTAQDVVPDINTVYYWYKSNQIFETKGDYSGDLLHGEFVRYSWSNELLEKGMYDLGVKIGDWKQWYPDGKLKQIEQWRKGKLDGAFYEFDAEGKLVQKGKYCKGLKKGQWVIGRDTLQYKKGVIKVKKPKKVKIKKEKVVKKEKETKGKEEKPVEGKEKAVKEDKGAKKKKTPKKDKESKAEKKKSSKKEEKQKLSKEEKKKLKEAKKKKKASSKSKTKKEKDA